MKKLMSIIFILTLTQLSAAEDRILSYPNELRDVVGKIEKSPEARDLIKQVQKEGRVGIITSRDYKMNFSAFWDGENRQITLNLSQQRSLGSIIRSIIFELHNAASNSQFEDLYHKAMCGTISRNQYILQMEQIEYSNALKAGEILTRGQRQGLFPTNIGMDIPSTFQEHFQIQCSMGHAEFHGNNYDVLSQMNGTLRA